MENSKKTMTKKIMTKKRITYILLAVIFMAGFLGFTYAVQHYDVQPVGPLNSEIGFATFNLHCFEIFGQNEILYELTQLLGLFAIMICGIFGLIGLVQWIQRKNILKVDMDLICMGIFYLLAIGAYVLFQFIEINYRPVLEDGALAASYPSSHTMLGICVFSSVIIEIHRRITNRSKAMIEELACIAIIFIVIGGRLLCGMHWTTDIIASVILSLSLICIFLAILPERKI